MQENEFKTIANGIMTGYLVSDACQREGIRHAITGLMVEWRRVDPAFDVDMEHKFFRWVYDQGFTHGD